MTVTLHPAVMDHQNAESGAIARNRMLERQRHGPQRPEEHRSAQSMRFAALRSEAGHLLWSLQHDQKEQAESRLPTPLGRCCSGASAPLTGDI
jgi:hypothetical protein